jgi:hypothetical protein
LQGNTLSTTNEIGYLIMDINKDIGKLLREEIKKTSIEYKNKNFILIGVIW